MLNIPITYGRVNWALYLRFPKNCLTDKYHQVKLTKVVIPCVFGGRKDFYV